MKLKKWDLLVCIGFALVLMLFVSDLGNTNEAARTYPMVMIIACFVCIAFLIIQWIRKRKTILEEDAGGMEKKRVLYIVVYCVAVLLYILLIDKLGYVVSTVLFGIYSLIYLGNRNKLAIIIIPLAAAVVLYLMFSNILFVQLPSGILI